MPVVWCIPLEDKIPIQISNPYSDATKVENSIFFKYQNTTYSVTKIRRIFTHQNRLPTQVQTRTKKVKKNYVLQIGKASRVSRILENISRTKNCNS